MNRTLGTYKVNENLSSETLFHFTNEFKTLELILKNGFQARFIYEKLPGRKLAYFVKTACFCDIPLGSIKEHVNWYGAYGIGINRPIAKNNGLSPVLYIHSKSPNYPRGSSEISKTWFEKFSFTIYLKQVRGLQMFIDNKGSSNHKWKTFYDEREWRYFPKDKGLEILKYENELELETYRQILNKDMTRLPYLTFSPDWIEYILIKEKDEIDQLIKLFKSKFYKSQFESLLTKVITIKQILNDF